MTNSSQTVTGTLNMDSFGNQVGSTGSSSDPYTYAGEFARRAPTDEGGCSAARQRGPAPGQFGYRNDGDAGLTLVGARYYDGQVGRFASRDTWLDQLPYTYCGGNPIAYADPTGHWPTNHGWHVIGVGFIVGGTIIIGGPCIGVGMVIIGTLIVAKVADPFPGQPLLGPGPPGRPGTVFTDPLGLLPQDRATIHL